MGIKSNSPAAYYFNVFTASGHDAGNPSPGPVEPHISATGGSIATSGDYKIHTFTSSGTFVVATDVIAPNGTIEYLIVAGGGGGGNHAAGGGGGGGFRTNVPGATSGRQSSAEPSYTLTEAGTYTVTVGDGGGIGITPFPVLEYGSSKDDFGLLIARRPIGYILFEYLGWICD